MEIRLRVRYRYYVLSGAYSLVARWALLSVIDYQNLNRLFPRLKIQPELLAQSRYHDARHVRLLSWFCVCQIRTEIDGEIVAPCETGLVDHWCP